jgi:hypothetical protein
MLEAMDREQKRDRLRRAAPDLLEALKRLVDVTVMRPCPHGPDGECALCATCSDEAVAIAYAAIKKAEGT